MPSPEMQARIAAFDWSRTPLGPRESWPQSLTIAVGIALSSRFPMFVWWGPQLVNIYNDAYVPILGAKHPAALGRPAKDSWAEIWDVVGEQAKAVMERGEATWNERVPLLMNRHGYDEQTWFTWSYSPIRDESGNIAGLFCACTEETGWVLAEAERDRARARLAEAFARSPFFLALLRGPDFVFEVANQRYFDLVQRGDVIGRKLREVVPEVEGQGFFEILDRVYRTGEPFVGSGVSMMLRRGGKLQRAYLDFIYEPLRNHRGEVDGILAAGNDVTERAIAESRGRFLLALEDALRPIESPRRIAEEGARLLGEHLEADRCAYADMEPDGSTFTVSGDYNNGVPSIVGSYPLEAFGAGFADAMRANRPYVVPDIEAAPLSDAERASYRALQVRSVAAVPLAKGGVLVGGMAVHQRAPRDWSEADLELLSGVASRCFESIGRARIERELRESESRFRQLADAMPQIVFSAEADGSVDYFNRRWYEYTGLPAGDTTEDTWSKVHTPEGLARVMKAWPEALRTGTPYEIEYPLRRHDGEYRWHLARAHPVHDARGEVVKWFGTNTDIHDRKMMEESLNRALSSEQQARGEAELASRMKDEFLATLSHELRTPLNAILGWSHIIRSMPDLPKQLERGADVIERNARAQATIIEDLLDMSAIISGKARIEMDEVDLAAIVRTAVETARPAADAKHVRLLLDADTLPGAVIRGDASRLQQVMWNLLTNAIKFTPAGGRIQVTLARSGDAQARLAVTDTGEGIKPDFLPHVFERFRQADATSTRRHGGLGLGLAIVKQLVEMHGGTIRAESLGEGRGATFTVMLPVASSRPQEALDTPFGSHANPRAAVSAVDRAAIAGKRIVVVDDEPDARELVCELLRECGAEVRTAGSAAEALAVLAADTFDILVSDIGMPLEDGYALMRRVRALQGNPNAAIAAIAVTAYARPDDRSRALAAGFQLHVAKPVEPGVLIAQVAQLARGRAAVTG